MHFPKSILELSIVPGGCTASHTAQEEEEEEDSFANLVRPAKARRLEIQSVTALPSLLHLDIRFHSLTV